MLMGGRSVSVTKRVPSAEADSILPTLLSRHLRAGLSRYRRYAAGAWPIQLTAIMTAFRNSLVPPVHSPGAFGSAQVSGLRLGFNGQSKIGSGHIFWLWNL